jgi:hypothetical protein
MANVVIQNEDEIRGDLSDVSDKSASGTQGYPDQASSIGNRFGF